MQPLCRVVPYADDTILLLTDSDKDHPQALCNNALAQAEEWFTANRLKLNHTKTQMITFSTNGDIASSDSVKLLGFELDSRLKWDVYVDTLCKRLGSAFAVSTLDDCLLCLLPFQAYL